MKICSQCNFEKCKKEFGNDKNSRDGLKPQCRECRRIEGILYRSKNKQIISNKRKLNKDNKSAYDKIYNQINNEKIKIRNKKIYIENRVFIDSYKIECNGCGISNLPPCCFDFDHINRDEKLIKVSQLSMYSKKIIINEINKCQILCRNCHRIKTWNETNYPKIITYNIS